MQSNEEITSKHIDLFKQSQQFQQNVFCQTNLNYPQQTQEMNHEKNKAKCFYQHQAIHFCIDKQCSRQNPFTCGLRQCKCHKIHIQCQKGNIVYALNKIHEKISVSQLLRIEVQQTFDKIIDQISNFREKILKDIETKVKYFQLTQFEKRFSELVQDDIENKNYETFQKKEYHFVGKSLSNLWQGLKNKQNDKKNALKRATIFLRSFDSRIYQNLKETTRQLNQMIKNQSSIICFESDYSKINRKFANFSSIIKTEDEMKNLLNFFNKRVSDAELLFKASLNSFKVDKYLSEYGKEENVLLICYTNKDKKIGGFTPLCFYGTQRGQYICDPSYSSFIFSLSNNDKFLLKHKQKAIFRQVNKHQICFGYDELKIQNMANNKYCNCQTNNLNEHYQNLKYHRGNSQSYKLLNGNDSGGFTPRQWEVWKISF